MHKQCCFVIQAMYYEIPLEPPCHPTSHEAPWNVRRPRGPSEGLLGFQGITSVSRHYQKRPCATRSPEDARTEALREEKPLCEEKARCEEKSQCEEEPPGEEKPQRCAQRSPCVKERPRREEKPLVKKSLKDV